LDEHFFIEICGEMEALTKVAQEHFLGTSSVG